MQIFQFIYIYIFSLIFTRQTAILMNSFSSYNKSAAEDLGIHMEKSLNVSTITEQIENINAKTDSD